MVLVLIISSSNPPNINNLFLIAGPPIVNPLNWSVLLRGFVPLVSFVNAWKLLSAFSDEVLISPYRLPCQALVPDLVIRLTTEPELRPYSGLGLLSIITYCCRKLGLLIPGPDHARIHVLTCVRF